MRLWGRCLEPRNAFAVKLRDGGTVNFQCLANEEKNEVTTTTKDLRNQAHG